MTGIRSLSISSTLSLNDCASGPPCPMSRTMRPSSPFILQLSDTSMIPLPIDKAISAGSNGTGFIPCCTISCTIACAVQSLEFVIATPILYLLMYHTHPVNYQVLIIKYAQTDHNTKDILGGLHRFN